MRHDRALRARYCEPGPSDPHVGPLMRAWAAPPTLHIAGLRAIERVNARNSGFACCQRTRLGTDPNSRTPQPQPPSAFFVEVVCDVGATPPRTATSPPPNGGNCTIRGATRRRHAEGRLLMVQNPHHHRHGEHRKTGEYGRALRRGPGHGARGRQAGPRQISHVISLGHFSRPPENVAIPTIRIQDLKYSQGNYVRHCCATGGPGRPQCR